MFAEISTAYLIAALFFLVSGGYVYSSIMTIVIDSKSKLRREYLSAVACVVFSCLFYGIMTITNNEVLTRLFWAAGFISYFLFLPTWIRFTSNMYTIKNRIVKHTVKSAFIIISSILSVACVLSGDVVFVNTRFGNQFSYNGSPLFRLVGVYVFILCIAVFTSHIKWWREAEMKRQRRQQRLFVLLTFLFAPIGFVTDFVIPAFTNSTVIPLVSVLLFPASLQLFISMRINKTLSITVPNVSVYIFESVTIPTLVLEHKNNISLENNAALDFFGSSLIGKNISEVIFVDGNTPELSFFESEIAGRNVTVETPSGIKICEMRLTVENDKYGDALCKVALLMDITESTYKDNLLIAVNHVAALLLNSDIDSFEKHLHQSLEIIASAVKVDCVYLWKNHMVDDTLHCSKVFEWFLHKQAFAYGDTCSYNDVLPGWKEILSSGNYINSVVRDMSRKEQDILSLIGVISILVVPIFVEDQFWGFLGFGDCHKERVFTKEEESILHSGSLLIANSSIRNEMILNIHETSEQLELALQRANAASRAKSDFLSTMSHEMRTPMNAIIGMTTIGKRAEYIDEKNRALNKIEDASAHLLGVISNVLDMAKIEANKLELVPIEYNFEKMLQKVIAVINFRVDEKRQVLTVNVDNNIPRFIVGDNQHLAQVITNLMSNAVKFTPPGGEIRLNASLVEEIDRKCELRIEVSDTGIGISPKQQERLFQAFEQADSGTSREYGGTGLGLVISKRIIELMNGKIWVESELGMGARFIFTVQAQRGSGSFNLLSDPDLNWKNVRILAVDDMLDVRYQFKNLFENLEIKCDVAADGFEACRLIEEYGAYDIYFIDWCMPGMDGIELTKRIKSQSEGKSSVVIMITAMDWGLIREEAAQAGVDKYLLKPLLSSMIIDCMNECLGVWIDSAQENQKTETSRFAGSRLLVVEDVDINREIVTALLEGTGLSIDCAENGKEALDMVAASPDKYDLVFMDMQMPQMCGLEATRRIRALPARQSEKLPIIAMTANVFKDDIEACLAAGMDDHIGKPLDIDSVLDKLRKYL